MLHSSSVELTLTPPDDVLATCFEQMPASDEVVASLLLQSLVHYQS